MLRSQMLYKAKRVSSFDKVIICIKLSGRRTLLLKGKNKDLSLPVRHVAIVEVFQISQIYDLPFPFELVLHVYPARKRERKNVSHSLHYHISVSF